MDYSNWDGRYDTILQELVEDLEAVETLRFKSDHGYQGYTDVDILLKDGRVFSYKYWYGSCCSCDDWEDRNLSDLEIMQEMRTEATIFDNLLEYHKWRKMVRGS